MAAVEFGVLGSIEARIGGCLVALGHARQRLLLAALLLDLNHEVSTGELANRIWGEDHAQRGTLYGYLSRLRKALAGADGLEIERRPAGYVLVADPATVDLHQFRNLTVQAREADDAKQTSEMLGQALGLWRGEALAGADTEWASTVREGLHRERLAVELDRSEVQLRLGQHAELVPGLRDLAGEHPLDERLARQVMLALYWCGRTAEALGHYQHTHRVLAQELGLDPGPELRRLHQQILTGDPALTLEPVVRAGGSTTRPVVEAPVPRQLSAPPALFTGRTRELDRLTTTLDERSAAGSTVVISAIGGVGGVGKTYLALHWAHHHLERFPDGQLYINLRGFDPAGEPTDSQAAVCGFLEALGVGPSAIPGTPDAQAALYRSLVADKRMLIVLDNAHDTAQVTPLLPGSPSCTVLVTSRHQLTGLVTTHAARPLALDVLPEGEARVLLARHLGEDRLAAEPEAVTTLLEHCAGLPLALSIIAARAATQPGLPLAHLAEELAEDETRLDALDTGELSVSLRAVFASSHHTLDADVARVFALLGLAPGPDISLYAAASLIGRSGARTRALLRALEATHLIQQHAPGRYRMHDLVRLYAAEYGHHDLNKPDREAALRQLVDFYLQTAHHIGLLLEPQSMITIDLGLPAPGCTPHQPADRQDALAWYHTERPCLVAAQQLAMGHGWHTPAWQLPHTLYPCYGYQGDFRDALAMWQTGLAAAEQLPDPRPKAVAHCYLGYYHARLHPLEALDHLNQALPVFEQAGDLSGQAFAHFGLCCALTWAHKGRDLRRGLHHAERSSQLYQSLGNPVGGCYALSTASWCHAYLDEHQQALVRSEQALDLIRTVDSPGPESYALIRMGLALHRSGQYTQALSHHHQAVTMCHIHGNPYWEAVASSQLGHTHRALGQIAEARHAWQHALDIFRARHHTAEGERLQRGLDGLDSPADG